MEYTTSTWNGFRRLDFIFEGHEALLIQPETPEEGMNYLIKTVYFGAFPNAEIEMLRRGWHLAYIKNDFRWGTIADQDRRAAFCRFLTEEFGLAPRCIPVGMSCGGLEAICFGARHPEAVTSLYLDAPVVNLLSCPFGMGRGNSLDEAFPEIKAAYGLDEVSILSFRMHPLDRMGALIENKIPVLMVYGDSDVIVPYEENGALLVKKYQEEGLEVVVYGKEGCGHHPHGLEDPEPIVRFMLDHACKKA